MKRILILLPASIAGKLILESFASGFEANKCYVKEKEIDKLTKEDIENFKPDAIVGYDYSYFMDDNCKKIVQESGCKNLIFYFGDEPKSKFAMGEKTHLYDELRKIDATVFVWDRDFIDNFKNCHYLPLAASPVKYAIDFSGYKYSISFVGRPLTFKRQRILCELVKVFKNKLNIFCYEKHFQRSIEEIREQNLLDENDLNIYANCWRGFVKTESELAEIYNSSKINLNITEQGISSLNYRVFEVLASGGFLLTDEREDLQRYFIPSKHLEVYKNSADLIDKINFYMNNLNIAQRVAQLGRFQSVEKHNYSARAREILEKVIK